MLTSENLIGPAGDATKMQVFKSQATMLHNSCYQIQASDSYFIMIRPSCGSFNHFGLWKLWLDYLVIT